MITLKYKSPLLQYSNREDEEIEASDIRDVLRHIKNAYGRKAYREASRMLIAVNGVSISLSNNLKTRLKSGDVVTFFPICGGG